MGNERISLLGLLRHYAGLPRSIYIMFVARIINRFGGFVHAFLSLFLQIYLGMSKTQIGFNVFLAGLAGLLGALVGGKLGDQFSRKKVYLVAQGLAAALFIPCAYLVSRDLTLIPAFLIASSFFSSIVRPVSTAMIADLVEEKDRKRAFSLLYLGINFGVALGPIVAAILLRNHLFWFFLGDAITTFIAVILVAIFVEEHVLTEEEINSVDQNDGESKEQGNLFEAFMKRPVIIVFIVFAVINSMLYAQVNFAMPLLVEELFEDGLEFIALLMSVNAVIVIVFTAVIHYLTQKIKPIYNIAIASLLYAVGMGMMAFITSKPLFVLSIFIWTIGEIQSVTNQNIFIMRHTPINYRARFMGVITMVTSAGYVFSPLFAGRVLDLVGQSLLWQMVFIGGIISTIGFFGIGLVDNKKKKLTKGDI